MKSIAIKYGIILFVCFAGLFLFMHEVAGTQNYNLRVLNAFFHLSFMYLAIRQYRREHPESANNYISGVAMGMITSFIGILPFTLMLMFYLIGDPEFMEHLQNSVPIGEYMTPLLASLIVFVEGIAVSLIGSYILTRIVDMRITRAKPELDKQYFDK